MMRFATVEKQVNDRVHHFERRMQVGLTKRRPLKFHLLTIFMIGLLVVAGTLIGVHAYMGRGAALTVAQEQMRTASTGIIERTHRLFREIQTFVRTASAVNGLAMRPGEHRHVLMPMLVEALQTLPEVDGLYIGYSNGEFFHLVSLKPDSKWRTRLQVPETATMAVRSILKARDGSFSSQWTFLDKTQSVVGQNPREQSVYDPRKRPWFKAALDTDDIAWAEPYVFATTGQIGITISRMISGGNAVLGVDLTLDELADFLGSQKISPHSVAAIFNTHGNLIVHPDIKNYSFQVRHTAYGESQVIAIQASHDDVLKGLYQVISDHGWSTDSGLTFEAHGQAYMASLTGLPKEIGEGAFLSIMAPVSDLTANVDHIIRVSLVVSVLIFLVSIPVIFWLASSMSRALRQLELQANNLSHLNTQIEPMVKSRVKEIHVLASALHSSRVAMAEFGRYVPQALVRKILQSRETARIGGERRPVTLMFTDIAGFTTITEATRPEILLERLSKYFVGISAIIHAHGGTINKYIGDAVMAMWNVPESQGNHVSAACQAGLEIQQFITKFNAELIAQGAPPFVTRIGIHTGEALVGHLGDHDHIEYTALGDAVNVAARLEGLNKNYATTILISDAVVDRLGGQFAVEFMESVVPKGRRAPVKVYSLTGLLFADSDPAKSVEVSSTG